MVFKIISYRFCFWVVYSVEERYSIYVYKFIFWLEWKRRRRMENILDILEIDLLEFGNYLDIKGDEENKIWNIIWVFRLINGCMVILLIM